MITWNWSQNVLKTSRCRSFLVTGAEKVCDPGGITEEEKTLMLGEICGAGKDFPAESFLDMLKKQVRTDPEKTALFMEGRTVSYGPALACLPETVRPDPGSW